MIWVALAVVGVLAVAVVDLRMRLRHVETSLAEARAVLKTLPEVESRLAAVKTKRDRDQEELERDAAERRALRGS